MINLDIYPLLTCLHAFIIKDGFNPIYIEPRMHLRSADTSSVLGVL